MKNPNMARNKLAEKQRLAICKAMKRHKTIADVEAIAAKHGVSITTVYRIAKASNAQG